MSRKKKVFFFFRALGPGVCCKPHNPDMVSLSELLDFGNQAIAWPFEGQKWHRINHVHCLSKLFCTSFTLASRKTTTSYSLSLISLFLLVWCSNLRSHPQQNKKDTQKQHISDTSKPEPPISSPPPHEIRPGRGELIYWFPFIRPYYINPYFWRGGTWHRGGFHPTQRPAVLSLDVAPPASREERPPHHLGVPEDPVGMGGCFRWNSRYPLVN